jgi:hypothetical protein
MILKPATVPPYFKGGFFGATKSGKTFTVTKLMSQFISEYIKNGQLAMYDSEPSAGFVSGMVKKITGKELIVCNSRSFSDLMEFTEECIKQHYVALVDSITHPWRSLCDDYLEAKKSRVKGAGGNPSTTKLTLQDWNPIKSIWNKFTELFAYSPIHIVIVGREGDTWETVTNEEGNEEVKKTGVKMKTETECGYEPSLLVQMRHSDLTGKNVKTGHFALVVGDRFDALTGKISKNNPDIEFFKPHINLLNIGGKADEKSEGKKMFENQPGKNFETIKTERAGILENIKDDIMLKYPGMSTEDKQKRIEILRKVFDTSSWTELEEGIEKFNAEILRNSRIKLNEILNPKEVNA